MTSEPATIDADMRLAGSTECSARAFLIALICSKYQIYETENHQCLKN